MEKYNELRWLQFLMATVNDTRLNVWHMALISALAQLAYLQNDGRLIRVSRSRLMAQSHIPAISTYHRYFKQLQEFGYIKYTPSYHPGYRSIVELLHF